ARLSTMGMLTIVGDNLSNDITIKVTPGLVTITGNGGTLVNGRLAVTSPGVVNAIQASMNGGDDTISIDPTSDFMIPGVVAIALGSGNNNLNFNTSGKISLGALGVAGGSGDDTVSIDPAADFMIPGAVAITLGNGNNSLNLKTSGKISIGALGVAAGTGQDTVTVEGGAGLKSTVVGNSTISLGAGDNTTNLTEMQFMGIGGLMVSGGA